MSMTVLVVDDEKTARKNIGEFLTSRGYEVLDAENLKGAKQVVDQGGADIILLDVELPDGHGPAWLEETAHSPTRPPIILITAFGDIDMAVNAMKNGAHDFLQKPIQLEQLEKSVEKSAEVVAMRRELAHMRQNQNKEYKLTVGKTQKMKEVYVQAQRAAEASVSVLITGETGSGKEVLAKTIHQMGPRADKQFIDINCAAIQTTMLESELFGYEPGAFTSAEKRKPGLMEVADGGILFLDEISSMPLDIQAKLLRALEERTFRRMGGTTLIKVDVQIIAASNRDLGAMMATKEFRDDLFYRLKVVDLEMPPLRERREDIPELVGIFIHELNPKMGLNIQDVTPKAMAALGKHNWPGNIRELRNVIERAMLFCDDAAIDLTHLPVELAKSK